MSAAELNRMLEEGLVNEAAWDAISRLDVEFLARFDLTDEERDVLSAPDPPSLATIGVHPMLAMWGTFMRMPEFARQMSAGEYFRDFDGTGMD